MHRSIPYILIIVLLIIVGVIGYAFYSEQLRAIESAVETAVAEQERTLLRMATIVDGNRAETDIAAAIRDCSDGDRRALDSRLNELHDLPVSELERLQQLFKQCGAYFADLYAANVAHLEREIEFYATVQSVYKDVYQPPDTTQLAQWRELLALEQSRSQTTRELVEIQRQIIAALRSGEATTSDAVQQLAVDGQNARETLEVLNQQSDSLRTTLRNAL